MRDYKLELLELDRTFRLVDESSKTQQIQPVASAFAKNMDRIDSLIHMPSGLVFWSKLLGVHYDRAHRQVLGCDFGSETQVDLQRKQIIELLVRTNLAKEIDETARARDYARRLWVEANNDLRDMQSYGMVFLPQAIEALLFSIVIGMWTVFETLAGDLWKQAVNASPSGLAALEGDPGRI